MHVRSTTSTPRGSFARGHAVDAGSVAWIAAPPAVVVTVGAMVLLGPAVAELLPQSTVRFWPGLATLLHPEPTEQARFLIALTAPLTLVALMAVVARLVAPLSTRTIGRLVLASQSAFVAAAIACLAVQWTYRYPAGYAAIAPVRWFLAPTLAVAAAIAAALAAGARSERVRRRFAAWTADSRGRRVAAWLAAACALAATLLPAIATDDSLLLGHDEVVYHLLFTFDEAMAVVDGRSPLGDFATQYASLWPYVTAGAMQLLGTSVLGFTLSMALLTSAAMLALLDVLRRLTRSTLAALLLFLPLLATSAFRLHGPADVRFSLVNYYGTMPLRYAGPFLLVWLLARHLDGARPRRAWPVLLVGGLTAINNVDLGVPALVAAIAALAWTRLPLTRATLRALGVELALGLGGAVALVGALLVLRTGALPDPSLAFRYARMFAQGGFFMRPLVPVVGMSTIIFLTYLAALATAAVASRRRDPDRLLVGMLAWSGIFGLGAAGYYVGNSIPEVLTNLFPAWAFALVLLTLVVLRRLARPGAGRPALGDVACLLGFGVLVCSLAQTPAPWTQVERLRGHAYPLFAEPPQQQFVAAHVRRGEPVVLIMQLGHRLADNLGIDDVTPYTGADSIRTLEQFDETMQALSRAHGRKVFVGILPQLSRLTTRDLPAALEARGYRVTASDEGIELWEPG